MSVFVNRYNSDIGYRVIGLVCCLSLLGMCLVIGHVCYLSLLGMCVI